MGVTRRGVMELLRGTHNLFVPRFNKVLTWVEQHVETWCGAVVCEGQQVVDFGQQHVESRCVPTRWNMLLVSGQQHVATCCGTEEYSLSVQSQQVVDVFSVLPTVFS